MGFKNVNRMTIPLIVTIFFAGILLLFNITFYSLLYIHIIYYNILKWIYFMTITS